MDEVLFTLGFLSAGSAASPDGTAPASNTPPPLATTPLCGAPALLGRATTRWGAPILHDSSKPKVWSSITNAPSGSIVRKVSPCGASAAESSLRSPACRSPCLRPNERWSMDFVYDQLADGRRFRCLTLVDDFTRQCLKIHVDTSIGGATVVPFSNVSLSLVVFPRSSPSIMALSLLATPSTSGQKPAASLSTISSPANPLRTPSSSPSMAPSAMTASTNIGSVRSPKPASSSNTGALTTITSSALIPPSVASLQMSLP